MLLAFGVVAELFNGVRDAEPLDGDLQGITPNVQMADVLPEPSHVCAVCVSSATAVMSGIGLCRLVRAGTACLQDRVPIHIQRCCELQ